MCVFLHDLFILTETCFWVVEFHKKKVSAFFHFINWVTAAGDQKREVEPICWKFEGEAEAKGNHASQYDSWC